MIRPLPHQPQIPSPSTIVLYGISATCKSTLVSAVLDSLPARHAIIRCVECITSRHLLQKILLETLHSFGMQDHWEKFGKGRCEHVSTLLIHLGDIFAAARNSKKSDGEVGGEKFVLVLDGIDRQRDASQMLLAALARLGEMIPSLTVVLIMNTTPRPLFLQSAGVAHINFPPYTRKEAITIVTAAGLPKVDVLPDDYNSKISSTTSMEGIYAQFVATVYDSLVGPTAGTIPSFRSICEKLWPRFLQPMQNGEVSGEGWDFTRLLLRNRAMFKIQGESMLVHHIVSAPEGTNKEDPKTKKRKLNSLTSTPKLPSLPYFPTLVLTSAYVASHTPQRLDTIFFSKFSSSSLSARNKRSHHRRRLKLLSQAQADDDNDNGNTPKKGKRVKTKITKSMLDSAFATTSATTSAITGDNAASGGAGGGGTTQLTGSSTLLTARPFTLERLVAIYHAIDPNPPANALYTLPTADAIYNELATLRRLRLVVPATGGSSQNVGGGATAMMTADVGEKWSINVSGDWVGELAKGIGVEVGEWLAGGLD
uniref:Origin recognition complex subunit 5 n=1 Tax=Talaromyces marneffei PM1 TaxID=1077442 RepID=A0A093V5Q3_TALMA